MVLQLRCESIIQQEISVTFRDLAAIHTPQFMDLHDSPFMEILYINDINLKSNLFNNLILEVFDNDKHVPLKTVMSGRLRHNAWITNNVKFMIHLSLKEQKILRIGNTTRT